jgi:hypothetical protein
VVVEPGARGQGQGGVVAARKQKQRRMSAQVVEDYQLRYEVVAGIDVAKESAVVCVRLPPAKGKHRTSHLQMVSATVPELAAEPLCIQHYQQRPHFSC